MARVLPIVGAALLLLSAWAFPSHAEDGGSLAGSSQAVLVLAPDWGSTEGILFRLERQPHGEWRRIGDGVRAALGRGGLGWGRGLHGDGAPGEMVGGPVKAEGDGRSPAGIFALPAAFGTEPTGTHLPFTLLTPSTECVDDPASSRYNEIVERPVAGGSGLDWNSSEKMASEPLYAAGVVVAHNQSGPRPGAGSCIFLHLRRAHGSGATSGCTALDRQDLLALLAWLDPARRPVLVQLPQAAYDGLKAPWGLP